MTDLKQMTQAERESTLAFVETIEDGQWDTMTVCDPWTVRHLVAHLTALGNQTTPNLFTGLIKNGFSFDKFVSSDLQRHDQGNTDDLVARFAQSVADPTSPPGLGKVALGEFMCHGEDMRRATGAASGEHPDSHIAALGEIYVKTGAPVRGKHRSAGLRLRATDSDWTHGDGPEVTGPGMDLILAITGRRYALSACEGEGLEELRSRCG